MKLLCRIIWILKRWRGWPESILHPFILTDHEDDAVFKEWMRMRREVGKMPLSHPNYTIDDLATILDFLGYEVAKYTSDLNYSDDMKKLYKKITGKGE